jgi:hypothetical protein
MGEALLGGLLAAGWAKPNELAVVEVVAERRDALRAVFPGVDVRDAVTAADGAVVAVKPNDAGGRAPRGGSVRASIAAGVPTAQLRQGSPGAAVVRDAQHSGPWVPVLRRSPRQVARRRPAGRVDLAARIVVRVDESLSMPPGPGPVGRPCVPVPEARSRRAAGPGRSASRSRSRRSRSARLSSRGGSAGGAARQ